MTDSTFLFLGFIGLILQISGEMRYFYELFWTKTAKPHLFTWSVWSLLAGIGFAAQLSEGEFLGSFSLGISTVFCACVAITAFFQKEIIFTIFDWILFFLALLAIPLWMTTDTPLYSVLLISAIDMMILLPSVRKVWKNPYNEPFITYFSIATAQILSLFLLNEITLISSFYIVCLIFLNSSFGLYILLRRRFIS